MRWSTLPFLLLPAVAVGADEAHTIRLKLDPDVGRTATYRTSDDASTGSMKFFDADGKLLFEQKKEGRETSYRVTVLARDKDGKATKFVRVYDKASEKEGGKTKTFSYQGRTVVFEKVGGKFRLGVTGEPPLDSKDVEKLLKDANKKGDSNALLRNLPPKKPVKVGDSWSVPVQPVAESMEVPADLEKSSITAKLVKVYSKDKSRFGTFELALKFALTGKREDGAEMSFEAGSTLTARLTVDAAIDGSTTELKEAGHMAMKGEGKMTTGGTTVRIVFDVSGTGGDEMSAETDDPKARFLPKVTFAADPDEWVEFKPKDGSFSVQFPGTPRETKNKTGVVTETRWLAETHRGMVAYGVVLTEFANPAAIDPADVQKRVLAAYNGARDIKEVKVGAHTGVEFKMEQERGKLKLDVTRRVFVTKERGFELAAVTVKGGKAAEAEKFFKSFQILAKPKDD